LKDKDDPKPTALNYYKGSKDEGLLIAVALRNSILQSPKIKVFSLLRNKEYIIEYENIGTNTKIIDLSFLMKG